MADREDQGDPRRLGWHLWRAQGPCRAAPGAWDQGRAKARRAVDASGRYLRPCGPQAPVNDRPPARSQGRPDLVERDFRPESPNQTWSADITYISTWEGFLYLAHVQDLFSRLIVGWSMADHLRSELVLDALEMAIYRRRPQRGLIHHSDQGCQFTAVLFGKRCAKTGIEISMGSVGDCYDNAVCETFHATLKKEKIYRQSWPTRAEARAAIFQFIESWYNPRRRHSTLAYLSPAEFEAQQSEHDQPALEDTNSANGSIASTSPRAADGLTTRRVSTDGVDFAADDSTPTENALIVQTGSRSGRAHGGQETNGNRWPSRSTATDQAR